MAKTTTNLGLIKPERSDNYSVDVMSGNMDIIDAKVGEFNSRISACENPLKATKFYIENDSNGDYFVCDEHTITMNAGEEVWSRNTSFTVNAQTLMEYFKDSLNFGSLFFNYSVDKNGIGDNMPTHLIVTMPVSITEVKISLANKPSLTVNVNGTTVFTQSNLTSNFTGSISFSVPTTKTNVTVEMKMSRSNHGNLCTAKLGAVKYGVRYEKV